MMKKMQCEAIISAIGDGVTVLDRNLTIIYQNPVMLELFGNHIGELCHKAYEQSDVICSGCPVVLCFQDGAIHDAERQVTINGQCKFFENRAAPVRDEAGLVISVVEVVRDITGRMETEHRITRFRDLYAAISHTNQAIIQCTDHQELFIRICRVAVEFGGFSLAIIGMLKEDGGITSVAHYGKASGYLDSLVVHSDVARLEGQGPTGMAVREGKTYICNDFHNDPTTTLWRSAAMENGIRSSAVFPLQSGGRTVGALKVYASQVGFFDDEIVDLLREMSSNISFALDNFLYIEQLHYASTHDQLTGLFNRSFFDAEIERMKSSRQYPVSIVMADIDGLKLVNDNFGHTAGDSLIKRAAHILRESFRGEDVVARIGGDEFAAILPTADEQVVKDAIKRVLALLLETNKSDEEITVNISLGSATAINADQFNESLRLADSRMYYYKKRRKT